MLEAFKNNVLFTGQLPVISLQNEQAAWRHISNVCEDTLEKYAQSLIQDKEILENDEAARGQAKMTQIQKNCIKFRINEKEILHFFKNCAD